MKKTEKQKPEAVKIESPEQPKEKQIEELTNLLKRIQADFENYKKRIEKEKQIVIKYAHCDFVKGLLPVLDSFEHALKNTLNEDIKMLHAQLWHLLSSQGLSKINSLHVKFDPCYHEVLMKVVSEQPEDTIIEELQTGYMYKDIVIRPTKVKIAKK
jgi:molecular chaperone GrpE